MYMGVVLYISITAASTLVAMYVASTSTLFYYYTLYILLLTITITITITMIVTLLIVTILVWGMRIYDHSYTLPLNDVLILSPV